MQAATLSKPPLPPLLRAVVLAVLAFLAFRPRKGWLRRPGVDPSAVVLPTTSPLVPPAKLPSMARDAEAGVPKQPGSLDPPPPSVLPLSYVSSMGLTGSSGGPCSQQAPTRWAAIPCACG